MKLIKHVDTYRSNLEVEFNNGFHFKERETHLIERPNNTFLLDILWNIEKCGEMAHDLVEV